MSYKYHKGSVPDHMQSDFSTADRDEAGPPAGQDSTGMRIKSAMRKAEAEGDTATIRRFKEHLNGTGIMQQGDPRKPAPVDTVALKKRIDNDQKVEEKNRTYYGDIDQSGYSELNNKGRAALKSELARTDTLSKARKGKIPAKP